MKEVNDLLDQMEVILHNIQAIRKQYVGGGTTNKVSDNRWRNDFTGW